MEANFLDHKVYDEWAMGYMVNDEGQFHAYVRMRKETEMIDVQPFETKNEAIEEAARMIAELNGIVSVASYRGKLREVKEV